MKKQISYVFLIISFLICNIIIAQETSNSIKENKTSKLFRNQEALSIKLKYSNRNLKKKTNDSTYIKTNLSYQNEDETWDSLEIEIRARGNFRKDSCYYTPVKLKIKKAIAKGTIFKGNKKLKLVIPCKTDKESNDNVIKEYLAYKFYEHISPYNFKTRLVNVEYEELRGKKIKSHYLKGFFIEDDKEVADTHDAKILESKVHPLEQEPIICVKHALFQYMIGNTDFSTTYQHNAKLIYKDKQMFPIPYDFDMSGLVNPSYAILSTPHLERMNISSVKERKYRGFKRDISIFNQAKSDYLNIKPQITECLFSLKSSFDNPKEYERVKIYILDFYKILENEALFNKNIIEKARMN